MKRLFSKLMLFLAPFLLALALFFAFEPYDYLGLRGDATYLSKPLSSLRQAEREMPANIILGDSRMANISTDYLEEITGERWQMMGFGGAQLGENIELFWYCADHLPLQRVVFGVSFYTSSGDQGPGRVPVIIERAESPWRFMTNANYWLEAMAAAKQKAMNAVYTAMGRPERCSYPEDPTVFNMDPLPEERGERYRQDLEDYCAILRGNMQGFSLKEETLEALSDIIDYCRQNGIELTFVFPPMQECVFELVTEPLGIDADIARYKQFLIERATVYDLEFKNPFTLDEANFLDGFHLRGDAKRAYIDAVFLGTDSDMIRRYEEVAG